MLISIFGGALVSHLLDLWMAGNVTEAYVEFTETKFLSWKKALYYELLLQLVSALISPSCNQSTPPLFAW